MFAQVSVVEDARDLRRLAEVGKIAEHLAFRHTTRTLDMFGINVDEDEEAARALMVADAFRYAPQRDADSCAAGGSGLPYLTGAVEGVATALSCADGVVVDVSAFRLAGEPYLFALAPLYGDQELTLVPKTRFWQALRDVREVGVDLADEVAQLLSATPLACNSGKALVPASVLEAAGISELDRSFTLIGVGDRIELWPSDSWRRNLINL